MLPYLTPDKHQAKKLQDFDLLEELVAKQHRHLYDYYINQKGEPDRLRSVDEKILGTADSLYQIASFVRTYDDNEDPTALGFDLRIKTLDSPLFNGELKKFIQDFGGLGNTEIASRLEILERFQSQLFKFLKKHAQINLGFGLDGNPQFLGKDGAKSYYLEEISGLDKLVEKYSTGGESSAGGVFVNYPSDVITLKFREDVTQNLGYLTSLYKALSWSRINGKLMVPENLLRFDCEIVITEVRDYMRLYKDNQNNIQFYVDKISRYTYDLYECQFFFTKMPHGDALKMNTVEVMTTPLDITFNYKFSTMKFDRFTVNPDNPSEKNSYGIDNKLLDPSGVTPKNATNANTDNGTIDLLKGASKLTEGGLANSDGINPRDILQNPSRSGLLEDLKVNDSIEGSLTQGDTIPVDLPIIPGKESDTPLADLQTNTSPRLSGSAQVNLNNLGQSANGNLNLGGFLQTTLGNFGANLNLNNLGQSINGNLNLNTVINTGLGAITGNLNVNNLFQNPTANLNIGGNIRTALGNFASNLNLNNLGQNIAANFNIGGNIQTTIGNITSNLNLNNLGQSIAGNLNLGGNIRTALGNFASNLNLNNLGQNIAASFGVGGNVNPTPINRNSNSQNTESTNNLGQQIPKILATNVNNLTSRLNELGSSVLSNELRSQVNLIDKTLSNFTGGGSNNGVRDSIQNFVGNSLRGLFG